MSVSAKAIKLQVWNVGQTINCPSRLSDISLLALLLRYDNNSEEENKEQESTEQKESEALKFSEELNPLIRTRNRKVIKIFFPNLDKEEEAKEDTKEDAKPEIGGFLEVVMDDENNAKSKKKKANNGEAKAENGEGGEAEEPSEEAEKSS